MKKFIKLAGVFTGFFMPVQAFVTSHTFFSARPNFQKGSPERQSFFRNDLMETCCTGWRGAFQAVVYGGRTTKAGNEKLAKFFLPPNCGSCYLDFQEYKAAFEESLTPGSGKSGASADYSQTKSVEARCFNIVTINGVSTDLSTPSFSSRVHFSASQSKIGIGFDYKQQITLKKDGTTGFWVEWAMPVERIKNTIRLSERIESNGGGAYLQKLGLDNLPHVDSVKAAFIQQNLLPCREKWGLSDIELLVGYNTYMLEWAMTTSYIGLTLPTGSRVLDRHIWDPVIGNNRSLGLLFGNETNFNIYRKYGWEIDWILEWNGRYMLQSNQIRSFDPIGKPWGRFLPVYKGTVQAATAYKTKDIYSGTFGNQVFRHCVKVNPHFQGILNQAFQFNKNNGCWSIVSEFGYNLFARQAEGIELPQCNPLKGVYLKGIDGSGTATTARTIKANYRDSIVNFDDPYYTRLELNAYDLDITSAAHPAVISQTLYGALGFRIDKTCPGLLALAASYEFQSGDINTALERWLVWAKLVFTF